MDNKNELIIKLNELNNLEGKVNNEMLEYYEESHIRMMRISLPPAAMALYFKEYELCEGLLSKGCEIRLNTKCKLFFKPEGEYEYNEQYISPAHLLFIDPLIPKRLLISIYEKNKYVKRKLKLTTHYLDNQLLVLKNGFYSETGIDSIKNISTNCFELIKGMLIGEESSRILPGESIEEYSKVIHLMYSIFCFDTQNMDALLEIFPDPMFVANTSLVMFRNRDVTLNYLKKEESYAKIFVSLEKYFSKNQSSEIKYCVSLLSRMAALVGFYRRDSQNIECRKKAFEISSIYKDKIRERWNSISIPDKSELYTLMVEEYVGDRELQKGLTSAFLSIFRTVLNMEVVLDVSNDQVCSSMMKVIELDPEEFDAVLFEVKEFINVNLLEKWEQVEIYNALLETRNEEIIRQSIIKNLINTDMLDICILKAKNKGYLELIPCMIAYRNISRRKLSC